MSFKFYTPYVSLFANYPLLAARSALLVSDEMPPPKSIPASLAQELASFPILKFSMATTDATEVSLDTAASRIKLFFRLTVRYLYIYLAFLLNSRLARLQGHRFSIL